MAFMDSAYGTHGQYIWHSWTVHMALMDSTMAFMDSAYGTHG
jgi:hypothetical protein